MSAPQPPANMIVPPASPSVPRIPPAPNGAGSEKTARVAKVLGLGGGGLGSKILWSLRDGVKNVRKHINEARAKRQQRFFRVNLGTDGSVLSYGIHRPMFKVRTDEDTHPKLPVQLAGKNIHFPVQIVQNGRVVKNIETQDNLFRKFRAAHPGTFKIGEKGLTYQHPTDPAVAALVAAVFAPQQPAPVSTPPSALATPAPVSQKGTPYLHIELERTTSAAQWKYPPTLSWTEQSEAFDGLPRISVQRPDGQVVLIPCMASYDGARMPDHLQPGLRDKFLETHPGPFQVKANDPLIHTLKHVIAASATVSVSPPPLVPSAPKVEPTTASPATPAPESERAIPSSEVISVNPAVAPNPPPVPQCKQRLEPDQQPWFYIIRDIGNSQKLTWKLVSDATIRAEDAPTPKPSDPKTAKHSGESSAPKENPISPKKNPIQDDPEMKLPAYQVAKSDPHHPKIDITLANGKIISLPIMMGVMGNERTPLGFLPPTGDIATEFRAQYPNPLVVGVDGCVTSNQPSQSAPQRSSPIPVSSAPVLSPTPASATRMGLGAGDVIYYVSSGPGTAGRHASGGQRAA